MLWRAVCIYSHLLHRCADCSGQAVRIKRSANRDSRLHRVIPRFQQEFSHFLQLNRALKCGADDHNNVHNPAHPSIQGAIGTDGGGPQPGLQRAFCDVTDGLTFKQRAADGKRLNTALIMTEFGATSDVDTGLTEIEVVADGADALSPPLSWVYWCWDQFKTNRADKRWGVVSRSYPLRVDGKLHTVKGGSRRSQGGRFEMTFTTGNVGASGDSQTNVYYAGQCVRFGSTPEYIFNSVQFRFHALTYDLHGFRTHAVRSLSVADCCLRGAQES